MSGKLAELTWPKHSERLLLRPLEPDDLDAMWGYRRDPVVQRWLGRQPTTRKEVADVYFTPAGLAKEIAIEFDGEMIGDLMLALDNPMAQSEMRDAVAGSLGRLGWTLAPTHHGQGFAFEAVSELLRICFEDLSLRRVVASCFVANTSSWRLMEKLGMRREAHWVKEALHRDFGWIDEYGYALLAHEWRSRR